VLHFELAGNTAAVPCLASAYTSLVKRAVQVVKAAGGWHAQLAAAAATTHERVQVAAAYFLAAVPVLVGEQLRGVASLLSQWATTGRCRMSRQAAASTALLAVLLARSLVQLADAKQAAGPQLYFNCVMSGPIYKLMWESERENLSTLKVRVLGPKGGEEQHSVELQWQYWQQAVLQALQPLLAGIRSLGVTPAAAGVEDAAAAQQQADVSPGTGLLASESAAADQVSSSIDTGSGSTGAGRSSSSSSAEHVKWGCLLRLQQCSPRWAAAVAAFDAKWPGCEAVAEAKPACLRDSCRAANRAVL
jgi:hypothetical protein